MSDDLIVIGDCEFSTLIAITPSEHTTGLMFKKWPPPVMSFPYNTAEIRKFWMRNTPSPLDIIFCRDNKIVDIKKGEPLSTQLIGPVEPVDLVVELPYGTASRENIRIGDSVHLRYSAATIARAIKHTIVKNNKF